VLGFAVVLLAVEGVCVVVILLSCKLLKILLRGTKSEPGVVFSDVIVIVEFAFVVVCVEVVIAVLVVGRCVVVDLIACKLLKIWLRGTKSEPVVVFSNVVAIVKIAFVVVCIVVVIVVLVVGSCVVVDLIASKLLKILIRGTKSEPDVVFSAAAVAIVEMAFVEVCGVVVIVVLVVGSCVVVDLIASKLLKILLSGTKSEPEVVFSAVVDAFGLGIDVEVKNTS
jgi:glutaredoxin-related protein